MHTLQWFGIAFITMVWLTLACFDYGMDRTCYIVTSSLHSDPLHSDFLLSGMTSLYQKHRNYSLLGINLYSDIVYHLRLVYLHSEIVWYQKSVCKIAFVFIAHMGFFSGS